MRFHTGVDLRDVRADLESVRLGLGREVTLALLAAGQPVLQAARAQTPLGPGRDGEKGDHRLEHIRDSLKLEVRGRILKITSSHPGAAVLNYGGTITPHGVRITFPQRLMGLKAGEQELPALEADLGRRIEQLLERNGLT